MAKCVLHRDDLIYYAFSLMRKNQPEGNLYLTKAQVDEYIELVTNNLKKYEIPFELREGQTFPDESKMTPSAKTMYKNSEFTKLSNGTCAITSAVTEKELKCRLNFIGKLVTTPYYRPSGYKAVLGIEEKAKTNIEDNELGR